MAFSKKLFFCIVPSQQVLSSFSLTPKNTMFIHPQAIVGSNVKLGADVEIGPFCIIEDDVTIGDGCRLESHVTIKQGATLGQENLLCSGAVIGGMPQHTAVTGRCGQVVIGDKNTFRENTTVHRAMKESEATTIGNENFFMVNAHIAHDCSVGNLNVLVNNVMLAGHVKLGNRAILGGGTGVHQFCRVGSLAMVGAMAHVLQDVPPFVTVDGLSSRIVGLNQIGLRRNGRTVEEIKTLKEVYRLVFRSGLPWKVILETLQAEHSIGPGAELTQFLMTTKRGIISERRSAGRNPLRLVETSDGEEVGHAEIRPLRVNVG